MKDLNSGYLALGFVVLVFFGLQYWWISMTIHNGQTRAVYSNKNKTDKARDMLEKIFRS